MNCVSVPVRYAGVSSAVATSSDCRCCGGLHRSGERPLTTEPGRGSAACLYGWHFQQISAGVAGVNSSSRYLRAPGW